MVVVELAAGRQGGVGAADRAGLDPKCVVASGGSEENIENDEIEGGSRGGGWVAPHDSGGSSGGAGGTRALLPL